MQPYFFTFVSVASAELTRSTLDKAAKYLALSSAVLSCNIWEMGSIAQLECCNTKLGRFVFTAIFVLTATAYCTQGLTQS